VNPGQNMKTPLKNIVVVLSILFIIIGSAFFLPRWIITYLGESHFLSSYLYLYISGLPFFILGIYALVHSKAVNLKLIGETKWLLLFIFGLLWYIIFHGLWILIAI